MDQVLESLISSFEVDAQARCGACTGEEVDGYPGEELGVGPGICVCPSDQFFVEPC